jgi:hypothetical protein
MYSLRYPVRTPLTARLFQRAHAPFELGKISRARKVLVNAALFGALEPVANPCEKEGKHSNLQEIAYQWRNWPDAALRLRLARALWRCWTIQS